MPGLESLQHAAAAEQHGDVLALAAFERGAVDLAFEIHRDAVALAARAVHRIEFRPLLAQVLHHRVDVGLGDLGRRARDGNAFDALQLDLREDLEGRAVLEVLVRADRERLDARPRGRVELLLRDGLGEARLHQVGQHFLPHLRAELLLDDLRRHLAGPEALELHGAADALQALVDRLLDALARDAHFHPALEGARRLDRNLHALGPRKGQGRGGRAPGKAAYSATESPRPRNGAGMVRKEGLEPSRGLPTGT